MSRGQGRGRVRRVRRGNRWVYMGDWTDASGKRHRETLGTDRETADRVMAEKIRSRDREKAGLRAELGQDTDLALLASDYVCELATRTTPKHVRMMERQLGKLPGILGARQVRDLKPEVYERYRQRQLRDGLAPATINTGLVALKGMLSWALRTRRIAENPFDSLRCLPIGREYQKRPKRALSEKETGAFLQAAYAADEKAAEHQAATKTIASRTKEPSYAEKRRIPTAPLFWFLIETGCRWGEARQIRWSDLDTMKGHLRLRAETTKNRRSRTIPLKPSLMKEIQGLLARHHEVLGRAPTKSDLVFLTPRGKPWPMDSGNLRRLFHPILKTAGIEKVDENGERVDIHSLRHTAATRLARAGWPMAKLQKFMGHRDPRTTQRYYDHLDADDLEVCLDLVPDILREAQ